jgi:hypothetical protein
MRAAALLIERKAHNLGSFYEMTYLVVLLGDIGLILGRTILDKMSSRMMFGCKSCEIRRCLRKN